MTEFDPNAMTLDPPGTIAVVGAGPLGIEAALYGRFLGYDVTLIEAESVGASMHDCLSDPLPMLPDRCLSPLAISALAAQGSGLEVLPMTCAQWVQDALIPLTESDLLAGRVRMPQRVIGITTLAIEPSDEDADEDVGDVPSDFRLQLSGGEKVIDAEAVVLAIGTSAAIPLDFAVPAPYFFRIGETRSGDDEHDLHQGFRQIVNLFAALAGRKDLDLYRPKRH